MLGPLLSLIFMNDLLNVSNKIKIYLFADEANTSVESENIIELMQIVNKELKLVQKWVDSNMLSLNISETYYIICQSPTMSIHSI